MKIVKNNNPSGAAEPIRNISLPPGVRDSLPDEAEKTASVENEILQVLAGHGYRRVITPFIEYLDVLSIGLGDDLRDKVFKFIDPASGKVVAIRPDITPQIARIVATRMRDYPLPLRVCYNEKVFRYQESRSGRPREIQQIGAELMTEKASHEADAGIIITAIESLNKLGIKNFKIDVGDVGFVKGILDNLGISDAEKGRLKEAIALKDSSAVDAIIGGLKGTVSARSKKSVRLIPSLFGGRDALERAMEAALSEQSISSVKNLLNVLKIIERNRLEGFVTFDLAEVRGFDYYTGIIFEGFADGVGKAIMAGGRYDNLMQRYGYKCAAVGFAFDMENVVAAMERQADG